MRWPWSKKTEEPFVPEQQEVDEPLEPGPGLTDPKPLGFVDMKGGNKHSPTKHKAFPNRMNRNKRMP